MSKQFTVPPVVFPSGGTPSSGNVQQRRVPTAPFQPPRPSGSGIPFMSFDIGSATSTTSSTLYGGPIGGGGGPSGSASFEDEEPLLDELGIHPDQIWRKTKVILNPFRVNPSVHQDADLSGPIMLYLLLCLFQLLAGKIQFGIILGWIVVSSMFLYVVFNMLAGRNGKLDLHTCTSVVGYCLLPLVILSAASLFLPQGSTPRFIIAGAFVLWSTRACTGLMVAIAEGEEEHRSLVALPQFMEDEEEDDLFEIDLNLVIPPPQYCHSGNNVTQYGADARFANCLLPIAHVSSAVPAVSCLPRWLRQQTTDDSTRVVEAVRLGKLLELAHSRPLVGNT